ncbi:hypothetical protein GCM10022243_63270 [Saccharothrix violaceirubra]
MASLREVGQHLVNAAARLGEAIRAAHHAADPAKDAQDLISAAGAGSDQADFAQTHARFDTVVDGITDPPTGIGARLAAIREYTDRAGIPLTPEHGPLPGQSPKGGSPEHIENLRKELPATVRSGVGQDAWRMLRAIDFPAPGPPITSGSTLRVYGPRYQKTFTGGMRAPWQRWRSGTTRCPRTTSAQATRRSSSAPRRSRRPWWTG